MNEPSSTINTYLPPIREVFLSCADSSFILISDEKLGSTWNNPSVCKEMNVGELASHLCRGFTQVETYLDAEEPDSQTISAGDYYSRFERLSDITSELNKAVRSRSREMASKGWEQLVKDAGDCLNRLGTRLESESPSRKVKVAGDSVMTLDQYLLTRIVELTVHIDDLALSLDVDPPGFAPEAYILAIGTLIQCSSVIHGSKKVLQALSRPERTTPEILRIF